MNAAPRSASKPTTYPSMSCVRACCCIGCTRHSSVSTSFEPNPARPQIQHSYLSHRSTLHRHLERSSSTAMHYCSLRAMHRTATRAPRSWPRSRAAGLVASPFNSRSTCWMRSRARTRTTSHSSDSKHERRRCNAPSCGYGFGATQGLLMIARVLTNDVRDSRPSRPRDNARCVSWAAPTTRCRCHRCAVCCASRRSERRRAT